ncbi:MAG TPA: glycoside hydrolase family 3 N-terminal domain-containing protein [Candidatus Limnocylindrales bacterium]
MTRGGPRARRPRTAAEVAARLTWGVLPGPSVDAETAAALERGLGGVVLFAHNVESAAQVRALTAALRDRARGPFRIAIDQEGGHIVRLGAPLTRFPSAMAIGATGSARLARAVARAQAEELAALGIDVDLAPVLDLAADPRNPTVGARSFGSVPNLVARLGAAAVGGFLEAGVAPVPKHFPGHGRTPLDSHRSRPYVTGGPDVLWEQDLLPFRSAVEAEAPAVMVGHVAYEGLTMGGPASLSPAVMTTLLRGTLDFDGVVVTDALVMDAITDERSVAEACVEALAAGADAVMPLDPWRRALVAVEEAIAAGRLAEPALAASLRRLDTLERRLAASPALRPAGPLVPRADAHAALAGEVARRSLSRLGGGLALPIPPDTAVAVVEFGAGRPSPIESEDEPLASLGAVLGERLPRLVSVVIEPEEGDGGAAEARARELAAAAELLVVATRDTFLRPRAADLLGDLRRLGRPTVHVALRSPYDLVALPVAGPDGLAVAAYADVPATLGAVADALTGVPASGEDRFPGRIPMALPDRAEAPEEAALDPGR